MSPTNSMLVSIDKLMRDKSATEGTLKPRQLLELQTYLAADDGVIAYRFTALPKSDATGRQTRRLECIISGWFSILDAQTLEPKRFLVDLVSRLVLVKTEADLPALEEEAADEDYIVCGSEMDIIQRVQEEILLALPADTPIAPDADVAASPVKNATALQSAKVETVRPSAFAKLAALKKN